MHIKHLTQDTSSDNIILSTCSFDYYIRWFYQAVSVIYIYSIGNLGGILCIFHYAIREVPLPI